MKDTKNLTEVVDFGLDMTNLGLAIGADGKVDLSDLSKVMGSIPALIASGSAAFADVGEVGPELADMDEAEAAALVAHVMAKLAVEEGKAKLIVEKALKAAYANYSLVKAVVA